MAFLNETGLQKLWEQIDNKFARTTEVEEIISKKPGRIVEGEEFTYINYEGTNVTATAESGAEIFNDLVSNKAIGECSHAEGSLTTALGHNSHAEGSDTTAYGSYSHAEGSDTTAYGSYSHTEGKGTVTYGGKSHAEGEETIAREEGSHTEGKGTIASGSYSHVQGIYNIEDTEGRYTHIVGNGEGRYDRSNAHTLDWEGNTWYAGNLYLGGTSMDDATIRGIIVHNSTTSLPAVTNGAILIAYDE